MDSAGYLSGYDNSRQPLFNLQERKADWREKAYRQGYAVASSFLLWPERTRNRNLIHELNAVMSRGRCKPSVFERLCGAPVDKLWHEFVAQSLPTP